LGAVHATGNTDCIPAVPMQTTSQPSLLRKGLSEVLWSWSVSNPRSNPSICKFGNELGAAAQNP
jgi:hypothetical protein